MEKHEEVRILLGVTLLYTIITGLFSLLSRITEFITEIRVDLKTAVSLYIEKNSLWVIVIAAIIVILIMCGKKADQNFYYDILHDTFIRLMAGVLVTLNGIIDLSSSLLSNIVNIQASLKILQQFESGMEKRILISNITVDIIYILIILCQILFGAYLIKHRKIKTRVSISTNPEIQGSQED